MKSLSRVQPSATPWTAAHQAPPSMGFSRKEYWSGLSLPNNNTLIEAQGQSYDLLSKANILNLSKAPAPAPAFVHSPCKSQEHTHVHLWHLLNSYRCGNSFPWLSKWKKCWSVLIYWRELGYWNPGITLDMIQVLKNKLRRTVLNLWMFNLPYLMSLLLVFDHEGRHKHNPRLCFRNPSSCRGQVKQANKHMKKREGWGGARSWPRSDYNWREVITANLW